MSASPEQVAGQPAMECIPLIMEPHSAMYCDPVIVLDFQSLYPSIVISRDICYSTCVGSLSSLESALSSNSPTVPLGANGAVLADWNTLRSGKVAVSPNGVVYFDRRGDDDMRNGLLPRVLSDLLKTRVAIKSVSASSSSHPLGTSKCRPLQAMKSIPSDDPKWAQMNAKQFGIKMLANVTYDV